MRQKYLEVGEITLGTCYYPEHWPKEMWADDLERMVKYGIKVVRVSEFAWAIFEPEEGVFDFKLFDEFMALAKNYPLDIIFCTPSATPPAWLTEKYEEVLNAQMNGDKYRHGLRRQYNYNSPVYNKLVTRIVEKISEHYGNDTQIIGWQIDNELNCEVDIFYSDCDHDAFRVYLQNKYKTLEELNEKWGTVFWSQTYTDWQQIYLPRPTPKMQSNPHMLLDQREFISNSACAFAKMQADILRKNIAQSQFITTNGIFKHIDYQKMQDESLDFITYDSYPNFGYAPDRSIAMKDRAWSLKLSTIRSISPIFGIMEQQVGAGGWMTSMRGPAPKPGQMRLWSYQSLVHGADFISFFRWRTACFGTEIYWHGLNDYSNNYNRKIAEMEEFYGDMKKMKKLAGARYTAKVALLRTHAVEWDSESDAWYGPLVTKSEQGWFAATQYTQTPMDVVYLDSIDGTQELSKYSMAVFPHPAIITQKEMRILTEFVEAGGTLVIGARAGYKDEYGRCPMTKMPGILSELCGANVEEFTLICDENEKPIASFDGADIEMPLFNDILVKESDSAKVLAAYKTGYYSGKPAIIENCVGSGKVLYVGAAFSAQSAECLLSYCGENSPYKNKLTAPAECELAVRKNGNNTWYFVLNYSDSEKTITTKVPLQELLTGNVINGEHKLKPYDVAVFYE